MNLQELMRHPEGTQIDLLTFESGNLPHRSGKATRTLAAAIGISSTVTYEVGLKLLCFTYEYCYVKSKSRDD